jgi:hypothetical protein
MLRGRLAKAGTIRSPNHASDRIGGIEMFDQPIVVVILLLFLLLLFLRCLGGPVGTSSCRKC